MLLEPDRELVNKLSVLFASREDIRLAILFGSVARGKADTGSDIDIAVEWEGAPSLLDLGGLASELETVADRRIDLVELPGLASREPYLAFRIASEGIPLCEKQPSLFSAFKTDAYIRYFDIKDFLDDQAAFLAQRIESGNFGKARHA